jgi:hypothetical protein
MLGVAKIIAMPASCLLQLFILMPPEKKKDPIYKRTENTFPKFMGKISQKVASGIVIQSLELTQALSSCWSCMENNWLFPKSSHGASAGLWNSILSIDMT